MENYLGTDCYYSYEHGEFIHVWEQVMEALDIMESIEAGTAYEYQYRELFRTEIEFYDMNNHSYLMEKDRLILTELCEPLRADLMTRWGLTQEELEEYLDELQEYDTATERLDMLQSSLRGFYGYAGDLKEKRMQKNMTDSEIVYVAALESNVSDLLHTYLGVPYEDMEALSQMSRAKMSVALKNTMKQCMSRWNRQNRGEL